MVKFCILKSNDKIRVTVDVHFRIQLKSDCNSLFISFLDDILDSYEFHWRANTREWLRFAVKERLDLTV